MWLSDLRIYLIIGVNFIWACVNVYLFWDNLKRAGENRGIYDSAIAYRQKAYDDAVTMRANEYSVCKTCGRIVQGLCMTCVLRSVSEDHYGDIHSNHESDDNLVSGDRDIRTGSTPDEREEN